MGCLEFHPNAQSESEPQRSPSPETGVVSTGILTTGLRLVLCTATNASSLMASSTSPRPINSKSVHIVCFKYTPDSTQENKYFVMESFQALATKCVSPTTGEPYILSVHAGLGYSEEGFDKGFEVSTFVYSVGGTRVAKCIVCH